jgi:acetyltransferase-like isoleucine patch superfamily enzyme
LPKPIFSFLWRLLDSFDGVAGAGLRYILMASRLGGCGDRVFFGPFVWIDIPENLYLGNSVSVHRNTVMLCGGGIRIGNNVSVAHSSSIVSTEHTWSDMGTAIKYNPIINREVKIESDVWIGCGVRILSGTHIGRRVIIAAGAVVKNECSPGFLYAGVPARRIKQVDA